MGAWVKEIKWGSSVSQGDGLRTWFLSKSETEPLNKYDREERKKKKYFHISQEKDQVCSIFPRGKEINIYSWSSCLFNSWELNQEDDCNKWMVPAIASSTVQFPWGSMACKAVSQWFFLRKENAWLNLNISPFFWKKSPAHWDRVYYCP